MGSGGWDVGDGWWKGGMDRQAGETGEWRVCGEVNRNKKQKTKLMVFSCPR
jgi:hypothetical protein